LQCHGELRLTTEIFGAGEDGVRAGATQVEHEKIRGAVGRTNTNTQWVQTAVFATRYVRDVYNALPDEWPAAVKRVQLRLYVRHFWYFVFHSS
jgi:hypothetical protein